MRVLNKRWAGPIFMAALLFIGCASQPTTDSEASTVRAKGPAKTQTIGTPPAPALVWQATFPTAFQDVSLASVGKYTGGAVRLDLDSTHAQTVGPTATGDWSVVANSISPTRGVLTFTDSRPAIAIKRSPAAGAAPYDLLDGTICAMATVNQMLTDTRVEAMVNVRPTSPAGSKSKQGTMARWEANRYVSCFVDFSDGSAYLFFAKNPWEYVALGTTNVTNFAPESPYKVQFDVTGITGTCRIYDRGGAIVATVGPVDMPDIAPSGMAGVMFNVSLGSPDTPLAGSASEIAAYSL